MLFDSHNHLQSEKFHKDREKIILEMKSAGILGAVVNATEEADWGKVDLLCLTYRNYLYPAYGIHPWKAHNLRVGWQKRLKEKLLKNPKATVGECGVDAWVQKPSIEAQVPIFLAQAEIAAEYERIMTVHVLKAWDAFFFTMEHAKAWPSKFLMHSFNGSIEIAERLAKRGAWFSISGYFLHDKKRKLQETFRNLPQDRILLETDAPDMLSPSSFINFPLLDQLNHPANLVRVAEEWENRMYPGFLNKVSDNTKRFWDYAKL